MNRKEFFAALRKRDSGVFGTSLGVEQVRGVEALLDACAQNRITDAHHVANILAQCYHETAGAMQPIKETVMPHHKDKNPSDAEVTRRLDRAYKAGQLPWVKTPYWREGWFGRGFIQLTHEANYRRHGVTKDQALVPAHAARVAVVGMRDGTFTGRKLADYVFPAALDNGPASNPRRIVNGSDGTDETVAGYHRAFHAAIEAAGGWKRKPEPVVSHPLTPKPVVVNETPSGEHQRGWFAALLAFFTRGRS